MAENMCLTPLVTEEDFNYAMGFTNESPLEARLKAARENFDRQYRQLRQADGQYYADSGPDSDRVFHLFPKLPGELQLLVWKEAVSGLPVPKLQAFDFDLAYDPNAAPQGRVGNGLVACFKPTRTRQLACHRGLLMACVDSRNAFLDSGDYHMLPLTYLVDNSVENPTKNDKKEAEGFEDYVKKTNAWFDKRYGATESNKTKKVKNGISIVKKTTPKAKEVARKARKNASQTTKVFVHVVLPVSFEHTRVLIEKVAVPFAYKSVHPSPPSTERSFTQAAGLDWIHSIKKLSFSMDNRSWNNNILFCDWYATSPGHYRHHLLSLPFSLGSLQELSYVSAKAVDRQCCIGEAEVWNSVPSIAVRQFDREFKSSSHWTVRELYRLHLALMRQWQQFDRDFNLHWARALRQTCTCRR
ncbi:hypothetical protein UCDDA912_g04341 [Diaporthe ampelina]|uniref:2EXR domain-containing protein n=1 Tax=Diaporthe ampelina TaxID=1214573 RepID=A0A0G2HL55_9PEZI|nr:hypothetical protein UCDDA912_g04341 [Diaporthe ampelina]